MQKRTRQYEIYYLDHPWVPNIWDVAVLIIIFGLLAMVAWGSQQMTSPYHIDTPINISLHAKALPGYAIRTVLRMFIALGCSLLFTFVVGTLAAKNKHFERVIIPFIDIMESVPILPLVALSTVVFMALFPNSLLGPECAAIFAVFTSQVWNMSLSFYQSLRTIPKELNEVSRSFQLSAWQTFWRIEVPFATPSLLWNTMISMSAGWFFVVESEAIVVAHKTIALPGIGSYVFEAIAKADVHAILLAIFTMLVVILSYDQLMFRPLLAWSEKYKSNLDHHTSPQTSWFLNVLKKTKVIHILSQWFEQACSMFVFYPKPIKTSYTKPRTPVFKWSSLLYGFYYVCFILLVGYLMYSILKLIYVKIPLNEILHVFYLGLITAIKVFILIFLGSIIWIPIGVWIGLRPKWRLYFQPIAQFLAAVPANMFYPLFVILILKYHLNENIWTSPLMLLGSQWYILFNVIAGTASVPKSVHLAAKTFKVKGKLWWKKLMLPAVFPCYVTGAMAAAGGCWNASIVADVVSWGTNTVSATGLGQYIVENTENGDFARLALGTAIMSCYVLAINRLLWHRLYNLAETRFSMH